MPKHLYFFRPGEEARMLARCQFGANEEGQCGALLTYPIKGFPWRKNIMRSYEFALSAAEAALLFDEVHRIKNQHPAECLANDQLWNDSSEKANAITRDRVTGQLCYTIVVGGENGVLEANFSMREHSEALASSELYKIIARLIKPYEQQQRPNNSFKPKPLRGSA